MGSDNSPIPHRIRFADKRLWGRRHRYVAVDDLLLQGIQLVCDVIDKATDEIQAGKSVAAPLSRSRWFPPMTIQMITVGEQSGELEKMLNKIADIYEQEVESHIMALTSMLEPTMILVMALVVGFIVISILLPIFEMNQLVR